MEIIKLDSVKSTNSYAKDNIESFADRTVICAQTQTSGRGRLNRSWVDLGKGNLFMSIVLKPSDVFLEVYPNVTQYLSVALCEVLETYGLVAQIKWPNDVLVDGKKIAGILSETIIQGTKFKGLVLGIGVNLNSTLPELSNIPDKVATALNIETGKQINLKTFTQELLNMFFKDYDKFLEYGFSFIKEDYLERSCFLNKEINVQVVNKLEVGFAKSIDDNGGLVLLQNDKQTVLTIGEIL